MENKISLYIKKSRKPKDPGVVGSSPTPLFPVCLDTPKMFILAYIFYLYEALDSSRGFNIIHVNFTLIMISKQYQEIDKS